MMTNPQEYLYSIGVVSRMVGLNQQTIRFYEQHGLVNPIRTTGNTRLFSEFDVEKLRLIHRLSEEMGVNLAGIEIVLRLNNQIKNLQNDKDALLQLLYEAADMVQNLIERAPISSALIKSSHGFLVKTRDLK